MKLREGNVFTGVCPSVIMSTGGGGVGTSHTSWDRSYGYPPILDIRSPPHYWHLMVIIRNPFKLVHLRPYPPPVLTSSGGHWNTYSWQAGSMHPTGMLSCYNCYGITAIRTSIKIYNDILRTIHCNVTIIHTENIYKAVSDIFKGDAAQKQR